MDPELRIVRSPQSGGVDPRANEPDDHRLVAGLRAGAPWATTALVARYGDHVRRVLFRVFGADDAELGDIFQEVITSAWEGIGKLSDASALKAWLTQIAVFTARGALRRRRRRRWLSFFDEAPEVETPWAEPEIREAARTVYRIFDRIPADERIPFALRMLEDMDLEATAAACGMSLSTVRRRLVRAERRFFKLARQYEVLAPWLESR